MSFFVFGSLNIDKVYKLRHLPEKGETVTCSDYRVNVGGKGLNQAIALHRAGADVKIAGCVGKDGEMLTDYLESSGVDASPVKVADCHSGHCVIEVDENGQNQMILFPGANRKIDVAYCDAFASQLHEGDIVLMQYETSCVEYLAGICHDKGVKVAFNPSPFVPELLSFPYHYIDCLILNDYEAQMITGEKDAEKASGKLLEKMAGGRVVITLGGDGAVYGDSSGYFTVPAVKVDAVDTTGAGDTFTGYFLYVLSKSNDPALAMKTAAKAAAIAVTKVGAAETIPEMKDVESYAI
ncbi:MAG: ribokinase [Clostridiales bacterium]|nr:ribokinase [Clostridiales bacterium]